MGLFVDLAQAGSTDVGINLLSHQTLVAQQFLYAANIGTGVQQVSCEAVPQSVWCCSMVESRLLDVFFKYPADAASCDSIAKLVDKHGR